MKEENNPFFSVIIPTYNRNFFLLNAIRSVLNQNFSDFELIVIDDGSKDDTKKEVEKIVDKRLRYFYQENKGRSVARNHGINLSVGKYICFLDDDDYYLEDHLQKFYFEIEKREFPIALFRCNTLSDENGVVTRFENSDLPFANAIEQVLMNGFGAPRTCISSVILKKHFFNEKLWVAEDTELWIRIVKEYPLINVNNYTVVFRSHPQRTVSMKDEKLYFQHRSVLFQIISEDKNHLISKGTRKYLFSYVYFDIAKFYNQIGRNWKSIFNILISIWYNKNNRLLEKLFMLLNSLPLINQVIRLYQVSKKFLKLSRGK